MKAFFFSVRITASNSCSTLQRSVFPNCNKFANKCVKALCNCPIFGNSELLHFYQRVIHKSVPMI